MLKVGAKMMMDVGIAEEGQAWRLESCPIAWSRPLRIRACGEDSNTELGK